MGVRKGIFQNLPIADKQKAARMIMLGILIAIIFGTLIFISQTIAMNASSYATLANHENLVNYNSGYYGYDEYIRRGQDILTAQYWMAFQDAIVVPLARIGVQIALLMISIGFLSLGITEGGDERTKRLYLIIGASMIIIMIFTVLFQGMSIIIA